MKRVLIITYYWPPSGGSGVQRWLKMSKYLPENGWQPVIYTTENAEYPIVDPSLEKDIAPEAEVIRRPIVEPYTFYKRFLGIKKDETVKAGFIEEKEKKKGWKADLSLWIRGNLFIPDARCWWVRPSVRYLKEYLKEHPVDAIISTGPPHSMHLIAMKLKKELGIPWIADFRDPWTEIDYYDDLHLTKWADRKHHKLERQVLTQADKVVTVGWDCARSLGRLGNRNVRVVPNGYDWEIDANQQPAPLSQEFTLTHLGVVTPSRNTPQLWNALKELKEENEGFGSKLKIRLVGQVDQSVTESLEAAGLKGNTEIIPYIPHDEILQMQQSSQVLLLLINNTPNAKGILTGKLFEYLVSGRPILCIGPEDGDAARVISQAKAGTTVGFDDKEKMKAALKDWFEKYNRQELRALTSESIRQFSRQSQCKHYVVLLDAIISNPI
ncbi:MAG: glycosyltransferase family 4 protein [Bacteroidales bacterium]|nr:glycosyltransferase family 4 protein [Bacteroidales bacterium]MBR0539621.1 glycosyltransferase family 4 protein [Bacteroidales bacterium]